MSDNSINNNHHHHHIENNCSNIHLVVASASAASASETRSVNSTTTTNDEELSMTSGRSSIFGGSSSDRYGGGSGSSSRRNKSRNGMIRGFVLLLICIVLFLCLVGPNGILDLVTDHHLDKVHPKNYKKRTNNNNNNAQPPPDTNNNAKKALDLLSQQEEQDNNNNMEEEQDNTVNTNNKDDERSNDEPTSVADALQCRASVVAFVINSTDKNDECEGLRKAFDQTCSDATTNSHSQTTSTQHQHPNKQHVRRNLSALDAATVEQHYPKRRRPSSHDLTPLMKTIESIPMEEMDENSKPIRSADNEDEDDEEPASVSSRRQSGDDTNNNNNNEVPVKKQLSPSLPTSSKHIDQATLQDAVILQKETTTENIVEAVMAATNQTTSVTHDGQESVSMTQAKKEASDSSKAVSTATAVVSAVLNDPETVEATKCCASIIDVYHEYCDNPGDQEISDRRLFVIVFVIAICGMVKSLIRHFQVRWLPEAAGCILVGVVGGVGIKFIPHFDFGFQHDLFLRLMVPPIVFEAALNIDKRAFARHFVPIFVYAVYGTLLSTLLTAFFVYKGTYMLSYWCTQIPFIESLTFGALISSIDPIAVLSVLSNIGMSDKDTIYVLIFGESLLNDGVAIVLFQTLMHFLDDSLIIDSEAIAQASIHFCVIAFGSLFIGFLSGCCATIYFWSMKGMQTPLVEVLMFLCWAFIPYYICDGVDWSGIVAIVAAGFVMDIFIIGNKRTGDEDGVGSPRGSSSRGGESMMFCGRCYRSFLRNIFSKDGFLSSKAKSHIGFVTEINATFMETSIFAYLGLFLFSSRYRWSFSISIIAIGSCVFSRGLMIVICSFCANVLSRIRCFPTRTRKDSSTTTNHHNHHHHNDIIIDSRTQIVLLFAGLRGAMSFALVETIPMYDAVSGTGTSVKPELKAMTSASILFTVFVLGGYTSYLLEKLGFQAKNEDDAEMVELTSSLVSRSETNLRNTNNDGGTNNNHHQFRQRYIKSNFSK